MKKTKIICTLGPATDNEDILRDMILAGMNVARLNFSHGSHAEHKRRADLIKKLRAELDVPVAIMIDTKGPDIRVGKIEGNFIELNTGDMFVLTGRECLGNRSRVSITYNELHTKIEPGTVIMLDDGLISLEVERINGDDIICLVKNGGILANNKSVNVPGVKLDIPYLRDKDVEDLHFAIDNDFDFIAASFVRSAQDLLDIHRILEERNAKNILIISKIENSEGIDNIDEILELTDSIMIARGDMGVELPFEQIPDIQKVLIKKAARRGRRSITATQMLESMIKNVLPTRAEVSDVANAIYDGTSAIMLSGETAVGKYPVEAVRTMTKIAETTEERIDYAKRLKTLDLGPISGITDGISHATANLAAALNADAIITLTKSGGTAATVIRFRPTCPVLCFTPDKKVYYQLSLSWGCSPFILEEQKSSDDLYANSLKKAAESGLVKNGDTVVFTAGLPLGQTGCTNLLRVGVIGE